MKLEEFRLPPTRLLVGVGAGLVLVALLTAGFYLWSTARERRMDQAWAAVSGRVQPAMGPSADASARSAAIAAVEAFLAEHPSAHNAGEAAYMLGNLRFAAGEFGRARAAWEIAASRTSSPTVRTLARLGVARSWEAERDMPKAIEAYQGLLGTIDAKHFLYEDVLFHLARVQELAGKNTEAAQTYQRILDVPAARHLEEAKIRLASLASSR
ncbi:MAG TPA: tetratricopeptide repeat protein [Candidatus Tectomicrobia bacterium]|nr:tetratricopeptide repeat protein [Candidatus Tectomicrobia bacterium]